MALKYRLGLLGILCLLVVAMFMFKETKAEANYLPSVDQSVEQMTFTATAQNK